MHTSPRLSVRWRGPALRCVAASPADRLFSTAGKSCFYSPAPVDTAQKRFFWAAFGAAFRPGPGPSSTNLYLQNSRSRSSLASICFDGRLLPLGLGGSSKVPGFRNIPTNRPRPQQAAIVVIVYSSLTPRATFFSLPQRLSCGLGIFAALLHRASRRLCVIHSFDTDQPTVQMAH